MRCDSTQSYANHSEGTLKRLKVQHFRLPILHRITTLFNHEIFWKIRDDFAPDGPNALQVFYSGGTIKVRSYSDRVISDSTSHRDQIGRYLPEECPLYRELKCNLEISAIHGSGEVARAKNVGVMLGVAGDDVGKSPDAYCHVVGCAAAFESGGVEAGQ